uniref:Uncharacterized protein n=1 Tax=Parascaris univalens TaxID=6257 RepID=A0A915CHX7_PARUN
MPLMEILLCIARVKQEKDLILLVFDVCIRSRRSRTIFYRVDSSMHMIICILSCLIFLSGTGSDRLLSELQRLIVSRRNEHFHGTIHTTYSQELEHQHVPLYGVINCYTSYI